MVLYLEKTRERKGENGWRLHREDFVCESL